MARMKDNSKRSVILEASKMLFSHNGFYNTSISDIARETGLPIGSIYTYFRSKDQIISTIIEDGWEMIYGRLKDLMASAKTPLQKIQSIIDDFFPILLDDIDFINIILTETVTLTKIEDKAEKLTALIGELLSALPGTTNPAAAMSRKEVEIALMVYLLGILSATRLSRSSSLGLKKDDITQFLKSSLEKWLERD